MEWIIVDDGTDKIDDIIEQANIPQIKYFYISDKMVLGKKRNFMHSKCNGDIIIYMDDDDYYPPERVAHAVEQLQNSELKCAGCSEMHIYYPKLNRLIQSGPYCSMIKNHATAATFAFKKELLDECKYDDDKKYAEESSFLKKYTIPMIQLDTTKTILVISHNTNTVDKNGLLNNKQYVKDSCYQISDFIQNTELLSFYTNL
jgi:glycosyltransferase involved in cell wall biosynthesis